LVWVPACLFAGWWQATRAMDGNALSFLYALEWPALALVGVWAWWQLLHTAKATPEERAAREALEAEARARARAEQMAAARDVDPATAAYNAQLLALADKDKGRLWKH
jgi:transglutaminase-like putative cysteine protease